MVYVFRQIHRHKYDSREYFTDCEAKEDYIWLGGNHSRNPYNEDLHTYCVTKLTNVHRGIGIRVTSTAARRSVVETEIPTKLQGTPFTDDEIEHIIDISHRFANSGGTADRKYMTELMEAVSGVIFVDGMIKGDEDGDWYEYICPLNKVDGMGQIQNIVFGLGNEFEVGRFENDEDIDYEKLDWSDPHWFDGAYFPKDMTDAEIIKTLRDDCLDHNFNADDKVIVARLTHPDVPGYWQFEDKEYDIYD